MAQTLEAQYQFLLQLKEIDDRAVLVEKDAHAIPADLAKFDSLLAARRQAFESAKSTVANAEKMLRSAERDLKEKEDALFKAEGKMMEVKTNEEYQAAMRENATQKVAKGELEDRVLKLITELEEQKEALKGIEAEFKKEEQAILADKAKLVAENDALQKLLTQLKDQRAQISGQMEPQTAGMYLKIINTGRGTAVACAENGRCVACHIQVRPQIYNEVLGHKALHKCGNCGRILVPSRRQPEAAPL